MQRRAIYRIPLKGFAVDLPEAAHLLKHVLAPSRRAFDHFMQVGGFDRWIQQGCGVMPIDETEHDHFAELLAKVDVELAIDPMMPEGDKNWERMGSEIEQMVGHTYLWVCTPNDDLQESFDLKWNSEMIAMAQWYADNWYEKSPSTETIFQLFWEHKKTLARDKGAGTWAWVDRDERENIDAHHSGFSTALAAMYDAVQPYLEDEPA